MCLKWGSRDGKADQIRSDTRSNRNHTGVKSDHHVITWCPFDYFFSVFYSCSFEGFFLRSLLSGAPSPPPPQKIIANGYAYPVDGDVYFAVEKDPLYGGLSGRKPGDNRVGERVAIDNRKRNPADFALWKVR